MEVREASVLGDVGVCSCRLVVVPLRELAVARVAAAAAAGVVAVAVAEAVRTGWESLVVDFGVDSGGCPAVVVTKLVRGRRLN